MSFLGGFLLIAFVPAIVGACEAVAKFLMQCVRDRDPWDPRDTRAIVTTIIYCIAGMAPHFIVTGHIW